MALTAILAGLWYTVFSEWLNTQFRQSWSYTEAMPLVPPLGTGLTPFLQWLIVPAVALGYVKRSSRQKAELDLAFASGRIDEKHRRIRSAD